VNRAIVIYNPVSGAGNGDEVSAIVAERLALAGWNVERRSTRGPQGATPIAEEVAGRVDFAVIVGGDGSIRETIAGLGSCLSQIHLGIVPVGNANVVARELGIPRDVSGAIDTLVGGHAVPVDVTLANSEICIAMVGVGWDALTVSYVSKLRSTRLGGLWYRLWADSVYVVAGLAAVSKIRIPRFHLRVDGAEQMRRYCAAVFCNLRTYGKGWAMAPDAHFQSGRIEYQARARALFIFVAWHVFSAMFGRRSPTFISDYGGGDSLHVHSDRPLPIQVDGDFRGYVTELSLEVRPGAVQIVVPQAMDARTSSAWSATAPARGSGEMATG